MTFSYFNSRPLYRGRHTGKISTVSQTVFQLTPPIQRATRQKESLGHPPLISTHAPYTEGDHRDKQSRTSAKIISTHAPYTEGDTGITQNGYRKGISTHAPYTEGDGKTVAFADCDSISTHAPYTEGDRRFVVQRLRQWHFNSRPLYRGRRILTTSVVY